MEQTRNVLSVYDAYTDGYNNAMTDRVPVAVPDELDADDGALWIDGWCDGMRVRLAEAVGLTHDKMEVVDA